MPIRPMPVDILVEIPKRLGRKRVIEVALSEAIERITQLAEDPEILLPLASLEYPASSGPCKVLYSSTGKR